MPVTAAVYYHPDAYSIGRSDLKGRHAAGAGFLSALAKHHESPALYCFAAERRLAVELAGVVEQAAGRLRPVIWLPSSEPTKLAAAGCLFLPGPSLSEAAWQRRSVDQRAYSLCGVTHTICSSRVMDAFGDYMIAPLQPWDALVVTSRPAQTAIRTALEGWGDYLESRFGVPAVNPLRLPVIPLGVDCGRFADTAEHRALGAQLRQAHGIARDDVVVLFFGRLSFHAKAHPLAMFMACERAQQRSNRRIHLILTGSASNPEIEREFCDGARRYAPSVNTVLLNGADPANALAPWFAADVFMSLSDNIQETFGLTPIEAMAAGLPVIVSDWDGYRDTITDGEVGFRIPTLIPPAGSGQELALRHALGVDSFDRYIGAVSQATAVDTEAAGEALLRLCEDAELRQRMGEAGRQRARTLFDWSVVVASYERLWEELAHVRATALEIAPRRPEAPAIPLRPDPFVMFNSFATQQMGLEARLSCPHTAPLSALDEILASAMNNYAMSTLLPVEEVGRVLLSIHERERTLEEVTRLVAPGLRERVGRTIGWLIKCGLVNAKLGS